MDFVGIADAQLKFVVLHDGHVTDADDLELLFESLGDSFDHIGQQRAREAVERSSGRPSLGE